MSTEHLKLPRSKEWPALRAQWLKDHPTCAACGGKKNIEVHHRVPVHVDRSRELDPKNLITLCESSKQGEGDKHCHLQIGHLGNWFNWNRNVDKEAYDHLLASYPRPGDVHHAHPIYTAAEPSGVNPASAPTPNDDETPPLRQTTRSRRRH